MISHKEKGISDEIKASQFKKSGPVSLFGLNQFAD